jgi:hypothetical protein
MSVRRLIVAVVLASATPALAVGLGPLTREGIIDGPSEGFTLDLYNPYHASEDFIVYAVGFNDDEPQARVEVLPAEATLGAERERKIFVVAGDLQIGETYRFRVCAQRKTPPEGLVINARVCSKITARRVG